MQDANLAYAKDRFNNIHANPPIPGDKKMIVTEFSLDHWLAQTYNLTLNTIPALRPSHIPVTYIPKV